MNIEEQFNLIAQEYDANRSDVLAKRAGRYA